VTLASLWPSLKRAVRLQPKYAAALWLIQGSNGSATVGLSGLEQFSKMPISAAQLGAQIIP